MCTSVPIRKRTLNISAFLTTTTHSFSANELFDRKISEKTMMVVKAFFCFLKDHKTMQKLWGMCSSEYVLNVCQEERKCLILKRCKRFLYNSFAPFRLIYATLTLKNNEI